MTEYQREQIASAPYNRQPRAKSKMDPWVWVALLFIATALAFWGAQ
jgi:hypothetical protein